MEQLGCLMTAMIAVIVGGGSTLTAQYRNNKKPSTPRQPLADKTHFQNGGKYHGIISSVAKEVGRSKATVSDVVRGKFATPPIVAALKREMARIDALPKIAKPLPLTESERAEFGPGGRYYGVYSKVARELGINPGSVGNDIRLGHARSRTIAAVRLEMRRIDAVSLPNKPELLTEAEKRQFRPGQRYYGVYGRVAQQLGLKRHTVYLSGKCRESARALAALRLEMQRVDAEIASKGEIR
jgi:hypothetical protein